MARRKKKAEDHVNHERWLVSYADFITLLFAFFVVMYSVSSVNEGKYRVLSSTLDGAFSGPIKTMEPIQIGDILQNKALIDRLIELESAGDKPIPDLYAEETNTQSVAIEDDDLVNEQQKIKESDVLEALGNQLTEALSPLIDRDLVSVEKNDLWVEVEMNSNMLFGSGDATLSDEALRVLWKVAKPIRKLNNQVQVEGFTDNQPINTFEYPSNWELSAARAASVVHLFAKYGIKPKRLSAVGYGEFHPIEENTTQEGREKNRRVVIVIQSNAISRFADKDGSKVEPIEGTTEELREALKESVGNESIPIKVVKELTPRQQEERKGKLEKAKNSRFNQFLRR